MAKRIPAELEAAMVEAYQTTKMGGDTLAKQFGVGSTTLYRVLRRNGIPADTEGKRYSVAGSNRGRYKLTPEQQAEVARLYAEGVKPKELRRRFGCSNWNIQQIVERHGVSPLRRGGQLRPWSDEQIAEIISLYQRGWSQFDIAERFKTHQTTISSLLRKHGFPTRRMWEQHGSWKGGRYVGRDGYVRVVMAPDDPLVEMRQASGYILEHRLVMARHLGRPLRPHETVHHINEDKADNRIENLQLRQGRHGKGVVLCCARCGSTDLVPVPLGAKK